LPSQLSLLRLLPTVLLAATVRPLSLAALSAFSVVTTALAPAFPRTALVRVMLPQVLEQALVARDLETLLHMVPARVMLEPALEAPLELLAMPLVMLERALEVPAPEMLLLDLELERALEVAQREELVLQAQVTLPQDLELAQGSELMQGLGLMLDLELAQGLELVLPVMQDLELEQALVVVQREELVRQVPAMLPQDLELEQALVAVQMEELMEVPVLAVFSPA
jgi:hypothetical protein